MPRGNRTGPVGMGPMTGHRGGYCAGFNTPGFTNPGPGYGAGMVGEAAGEGGAGEMGFMTLERLPGVITIMHQPGLCRPRKSRKQHRCRIRRSGLKAQLDDINKRIEELDKA